MPSNQTTLPRIIPRLDIKGPNLVKGISFEGLRVLGKPEQFAREYYLEGADELIYMDVVASLYGRNSLLSVIEAMAGEIFIPLTVGGGLRTIEDIRQALRAGADKICLNTAALKQPELIREAAEIFGSSTVVVSIEAYRRGPGDYEAYSDYGREKSDKDAVDWAAEAASMGAGELLVTSINRDGTGQGLDAELLKAIRSRVAIPVIAGGGCGCWEHAREGLVEIGCDAVSLASMVHYATLRKLEAWNADYSAEGNTQYLARRSPIPSKLTPAGMREIKQRLVETGIACRPAPEERHA